MPHEVNAESGLPACKQVLEVVRDHFGWSVTTEDSLTATHDYAIAIDAAPTAEVLNVHVQVVSTCCTIDAIPYRRCVPNVCLKGKWCPSGSNLPKESTEESDAHVKTNVQCYSVAITDKRTPEADQVSMTLRKS